MSWIILVVLIVVLIYLVKSITKRKKVLPIISFCLVLTFFVYSFFTTSGSIRLVIATMGHPLEAYTTDLVEGRQGQEHRYFKPDCSISVVSGDMLYIECQDYGLLKVSNYYGF